MMQSLLFKILQRKFKFRNPNHYLQIPPNFIFTKEEYESAQLYLERLQSLNINWTYPGDIHYPQAFHAMKEPPLFIEYKGKAHWEKFSFLSVVGSRQISSATEAWMKNHLSAFINQSSIGIVSGGAFGVDQLAHTIAIKSNRATLFILPSGLENMYPMNLKLFMNSDSSGLCTFMTEFELDQKLHKSHFYFRNRLIAALSEMTLVTQASVKSGSFLTVHHCLEFGKPLLVIPAHPEMIGFDGNLKLIRDGAYPIANSDDLLDFWKAELWGK